MINSFFAPKKAATSSVPSSSFSPSKKRKAEEEQEGPNAKKASPAANVPGPASPTKAGKRPCSDWRGAFESMEPSWKAAMGPVLSKSRDKLVAFLEAEEAAGRTVFPPAADLFSFMHSCPLDKVQVVIVGQDPYHGPGQAHGMCFSVRKGVQVPPSLRNMLKEAEQDQALVPRITGSASHGNLSSWSSQGVLLLNTCLTVRKAEPLSHKGRGWEDFTDQVIRQCTKRTGVVYLCWGKEAQNKCARVNRSANLVVSTSHPSPLGAYKTAAPFMGSGCFSQCNKWLEGKGKSPIDWNLK